MPVDVLFSEKGMWPFLLVMGRVSGLLAFLPAASWRTVTPIARIVLAVAISIALYPVWPRTQPAPGGMGTLALWTVTEGVFGIASGLAASFVVESFALAAQVFGLQAGYGYASTIDPASYADSTVLQAMAQLTAWLLFFAFGLDREAFRVLAASFHVRPAGTPIAWSDAAGLISLGTDMWTNAMRLALPILALLLMVDVALALLSRINSQLQLLTLAFPIKMLAALAMLALLAGSYPSAFAEYAQRAIARWPR